MTSITPVKDEMVNDATGIHRARGEPMADLTRTNAKPRLPHGG